MSELENTLAFQITALGLPLPAREFRFAGISGRRRWRFDFAWPDQMVAAEVDGATWVSGRHNRGGGIENDAEKVSEAAACGWRVLRFTSQMVTDGRALQLIERAVGDS